MLFTIMNSDVVFEYYHRLLLLRSPSRSPCKNVYLLPRRLWALLRPEGTPNFCSETFQDIFSLWQTTPWVRHRHIGKKQCRKLKRQAETTKAQIYEDNHTFKPSALIP